MIIKPIEKNDFEFLIKDAEKEKIYFSNHTEYYGIYDDECLGCLQCMPNCNRVEQKLIGITGIVFSKNKAKFKNHYILPEYRGKGYFKKALDWSIELVRNKGIHIVEANCTDMSINEYLKRGAKIVKEYNVCKQVILEIWKYIHNKMYLTQDLTE